MLNRIIQKAGDLLRDDLEPAYRRMVEDLMRDLEALRDGVASEFAPTDDSQLELDFAPETAPEPTSAAPPNEAFVPPIPPVAAAAESNDSELLVNGQPAQPAPLPGAGDQADETLA
jgi:hypothetical protein